ncbi:hypothetical protein PPERSA_05953 [Pseudocohnilembus persalinus]|uniref:Uncharacterized protein n=1 Tax=Pseudocohnilembus persalinus TaxID=266149 RepID=A0A0V0R473_PSEPJ|nr:hypothetical protein PPERSA_05953 [Pseudocohnilembus persalinus]|eukprot:KRX09284.1 hypothetical protein PPERSA_05953 [Pseudocohnilembus persalinus]
MYADEEQYSDMDSEQLQRANEVLDERDDINRRRNRKQGHGIRERLLDFLDEDSSDLQHYGQRFQMRQYQEDQDMKMESEEEEEEKFQEEKFLDRDNVKGKLSEWIQEDRTVRYIKYQFKKQKLLQYIELFNNMIIQNIFKNQDF